MEENVQVQDEISLSEIFRILWRKVKVLAIVLAAGILGGVAIGFVKNVGKTYYGTAISYYVNPYKEPSSDGDLPIYGSYGDPVTDTVKVLLSKEIFAEKILDGMTNVPEKYLEVADGERKKINPEYAKAIYKVQESLTVEATSGTNNIFDVTISVLNDEAYAEELRDRINEVVPEFLEQNMPLPSGSGYVGTECQSLTVVDEIVVVNEGEMLKDMIKFGLLLGAATFIVGCVAVVAIDRNKKSAEKATEKTEA